MLATSQVPVTISAIDTIIVCGLLAFVLFSLIIKIVASLRRGIKGSLFIMLSGIMSFILWGTVFLNTNYGIGDVSIKVNCLILEIIGIIVSLVAIISQFVQNHVTKNIKKTDK